MTYACFMGKRIVEQGQVAQPGVMLLYRDDAQVNEWMKVSYRYRIHRIFLLLLHWPTLPAPFMVGSISLLVLTHPASC